MQIHTHTHTNMCMYILLRVRWCPFAIEVSLENDFNVKENIKGCHVLRLAYTLGSGQIRNKDLGGNNSSSFSVCNIPDLTCIQINKIEWKTKSWIKGGRKT